MTGSFRPTYPASVRIRRRSEYREVYDHGVRVVGTFLVVFARRSPTGTPRLGITATRKVGGSVVRNRMRRLVREAFRHQRAVIGPWDLVVNIRPGVSGATAPLIASELAQSARRLGRRLAAADGGGERG